jgi:hypothetical protein
MIPINATTPRHNRIGFIEKSREARAEEGTICMKNVTAPYNRGQAGVWHAGLNWPGTEVGAMDEGICLEHGNAR